MLLTLLAPVAGLVLMRLLGTIITMTLALVAPPAYQQGPGPAGLLTASALVPACADVEDGKANRRVGARALVRTFASVHSTPVWLSWSHPRLLSHAVRRCSDVAR